MTKQLHFNKRFLPLFLILFMSMGTVWADDSDPIVFGDANVKAICVANWDEDGDGELSYAEAASVWALEGNFMQNDEITSFDEMRFFTGLSYVDQYEFSSCDNLAVISIPLNVVYIGYAAFENCNGLTAITMNPVVPPFLDGDVFYGVPHTVTLHVPSCSAAAYQAADGWDVFSNLVEFDSDYCPIIFADALVKAICVTYWDSNGDGELSFPEAAAVTDLGSRFKSKTITSFNELQYFTGLTSIGNQAFYGCSGLTAVSIPNSVTSIGNQAFYGCSGLTAIEIPDSVTSIGSQAFSNCNNLISVTLNSNAIASANYTYSNNLKNIFGYQVTNYTFGPSVTSIGAYAFYNCYGLTTISIPNSVTSIGAYAFLWCGGLTSIAIPNSVASIGEGVFSGCSGLTTIEIPNSVSSIGDYAFSDCSGLTTIEIPNTVTSIGNGAFSGCSGLATISIPNSVASIGNETFYHCSSLTTIEIPNSVTSIGNSAFSGCSGLTTIEIPNSVTSIGDYAFGWCGGLTTITIPNSVVSISEGAFSGCSSLTTLEIPDSVISIGEYAFYGCSGLTTLSLSNSVISIGDYAFSYCSGLTTIEIPNSVTSIGNWAFGYCSGLTSITSYATTPPALGDDAFLEVYCGAVHVPCGTSELYQVANGWSDFGFIEIISDDCSIDFADDNVKAICVANWDTNGDGELSYGEAAAITSLGTYFKNNTTIVSFDELEYFASLTMIPNEAFHGCSSLASVTLPSSITSIGNSSFYNCSSLTTMSTRAITPPAVGTDAFNNVSSTMVVIIPCGSYEEYHNSSSWNVFSLFENCNITFADAKVKSICVANWETNGDGELSYAEAAAVIDLGLVFRSKDQITSFNELQYFTGLASIGNQAFEGCGGLISISLPNSVTTLGDGAFSGSGLVTIEIPNSVTTLGDDVFSYCSGLTTLSLPNSVTSIGEWAFYGCSGLATIEIPNSVTTLGDGAFSGCSGLVTIEIPNSVTTLGDDVFSYCSGLTTLSLPNSVTSIGEWAFYGCSGLTTLSLPNSVTSIGGGAFSGCSGLTTISIPNSVASIGERVFSGCSGLTTISIPNSVTSIGDNAFYGCSGLVTIEIPNSVTSIGNSTFSGCSGLVTIEIPNSVTSIGNSTFSGCSGLTTIEIPNSVSSIGDYAFSYCSGLTTIEIPNSVTSIGDYAFGWCGGLTTISIPDSVTSIEDGAFSYCSGLTTITIPNSVTSIGDGAFDGCSGLTTISIPNSITSIGNWAFSNCSGLTTIEIPNSVTTIGYYAFSGCSGLTTIEIPNSVTSIGECAFYGCSGLISITLYATIPPTIGSLTFYSVPAYVVHVPCGTSELYQVADGWSDSGFSFVEIISDDCSIDFADDNVKSICVANWDTNGDGELSYGEAAAVTSLGTYFKNNTTIVSFDELEYFTSVTVIPNEAFHGCSSLASVTLPSSIVSLGTSSFYNCTGLTSMSTRAITPPAVGTDAFNNVSSTMVVIIPCGSYEEYHNSSSWNVFSLFEDCNITFADANVKAICVANWETNGDGELSYAEAAAVTALGLAFRSKDQITSFNELQYFTGLASIGNQAFEGCSGLISISIPNSVTSIGSNTFNGCSGLTTIEIPNSVTSIGNSAFSGCSGLTTIEIPNSVTFIGDCAFCYCSGLTTISIPNSVTSIRGGAFYGCSGLTTIEIPNSVTSIGNGAFGGCSGLTTISIPNSVTSIGDDAFFDCRGLTTITSYATTPPVLSNAFAGVLGTVVINVPCGTSGTYQAASGWSNFTNYNEMCSMSFIADGNWSTMSNWEGGFLPDENVEITIEANCVVDANIVVKDLTITSSNSLTINSNNTLTVTGTLTNNGGGADNLVINEGGQLVNPSSGVNGTLKKQITGYGTSEDGWYTIAAPIYAGMPVNTLITDTYDLYYYDEPSHYWMNQKDATNNLNALNPAQGYLYASQAGRTVSLAGQLNPSNAELSIPVTYTSGDLAGFNLVGNPYTNNINIGDVKVNGTAQTAFYRAEGGSSFVAYVAADNEPIKPGDGFMVKTTESGTLTFGSAATRGEKQQEDRYVRLVLSKDGQVADRAYLRMNDGEALEKFSTTTAHSQLYFKNNGESYAVAANEAEDGAMPLYLEKANGTYTVEATLLNAECDYLHLVDNLTGADIDLLATPNYTFTSKPTDYASRFRLVFDAQQNGSENDQDGFAFIHDGNLIVNGTGTLQVIDVTGRVVSSHSVSNHASIDGLTAGVYVLRLINNDHVKIQKIVIK